MLFLFACFLANPLCGDFEQDVKKRHNVHCDMYYECNLGYLNDVQECAPGTVFNPNIQVCDYLNNTDCGNLQIPQSAIDFALGKTGGGGGQGCSKGGRGCGGGSGTGGQSGSWGGNNGQGTDNGNYNGGQGNKGNGENGGQAGGK